MHAFIQGILTWYFNILDQFGLLGVAVLMALESSIFPVPSELVIPPAAYLVSHDEGGGAVGALLVILAGTVGSYVGSAMTYAVARLLGRPLIVKYGKYLLIPEKKLVLAEKWVATYGAGGVFFARLLPVVRHLISIPTGIITMRFRTFSLMTLIGSAIWCTVLTVFGLVMAEDMAAVRHGVESTHYRAAFHNLTIATVGMVGIMLVLYIIVLKTKGGAQTPAEKSLNV